ncbi:Flp family type IVb pilin [Photobacterium ganghwense]|uniref:Flp family type IVb pilin n=1 Tax=Photobacterium ganghwense TaxID=320778 RepID=UPI000A078C91|nr:Flp family type IVb pilin [Photobacterium ganghwense]PSU05389.1 Flp family type IVb pilin [Photobacterium ganghwense]QSV17236.1 Flp family type IVb pilin [Photobacterium ganghwense]
MKSVKELFIEFCRDEEGLTTVEYAVAGSLVAAGVVTAFSELGTTVKTTINTLITSLGGKPTT